MKINLIIGAGQIGSRHLQGLLKYNQEQVVYVLDPSETSLKTAIQRAREINHKHKLYFVSDWDKLPAVFDLAIIATSADVREDVLVRLTSNFQVKYLVLEKVLFQTIEAYQRVGEELKRRQVEAWVNHPRRMFESYEQLAQILDSNSHKIMSIHGGEWGLGCNALHFIDLFMYLAGTTLQTLETNWIDNEIISSKRAGFIEFTGALKGMLDNGSIFMLSSSKGNTIPCTISIFDSDSRVLIQETGTPSIIGLKRKNNFSSDIRPFIMEYQSSLTTRLVEDLFEKHTCRLPSYELSSQTHVTFIRNMLEKYNEITGKKSNRLPIT